MKPEAPWKEQRPVSPRARRRGLPAVLALLCAACAGGEAWEAAPGSDGAPVPAERFPRGVQGLSAQSGTPMQADQLAPSVAWDGSQFFVVWRDNRPGEGASDIYGARVRADGTLVDVGGIAISTAPGLQFNPAVAFDGTNFLVVWSDTRNLLTVDIYGARVRPDGTVLDTQGIAIARSLANSDKRDAAAACRAGSECLVVWWDTISINGAVVLPSGAVQGPSTIHSSNVSKFYPSVATNGTEYLVAWQHRSEGSDSDIHGAFVTPGPSLASTPFAIAALADEQTHPAVASDGTSYLVAWGHVRQAQAHTSAVYAARVSKSAGVQDPGGFLAGGAPGFTLLGVAASFEGTDYSVAWASQSLGGSILGNRVTPGGAVGTGMVLSSGNLKTWPALASGGGQSLAVWGDHRNPSVDIYGTRLSGTTVLDATGLLVTAQ